MLGRFLEVSVHAPDVPESLAFYESLGFVQATAGDTWNHAYAVVTDGRLFLGLHGRRFDSPALTWVQPELAAHAVRLQAAGIEFTFARLGEDALHEIGFTDPSGQAITLVEARTFSPPPFKTTQSSALGYFEEFGIPAADPARCAAFWETLGFVAFDPVREPFLKIVATGRDLNLGFYDIELRGPVLTFSAADMAMRIAGLREQGYRMLDRLPRGLDPTGNAVVEAPEGSRLLLTTSED